LHDTPGTLHFPCPPDLTESRKRFDPFIARALALSDCVPTASFFCGWPAKGFTYHFPFSRLLYRFPPCLERSPPVIVWRSLGFFIFQLRLWFGLLRPSQATRQATPFRHRTLVFYILFPRVLMVFPLFLSWFVEVLIHPGPHHVAKHLLCFFARFFLAVRR